MNINEIPLVGQPAAVHAGDVSAVVTCLCKPGNAPFLIPSIAVTVSCVHCNHVYRLVVAQYEAGKMAGPVIGVAQVGIRIPQEEKEENKVTVN